MCTKCFQIVSVPELMSHSICHIFCFCAQHVKDKFWNFVFYKFIFVFGVLNVQEVGEVVSWCAWFSVLCLLHLLTQLSKDRFEYVSVLNPAVWDPLLSNVL